MTFKLRDSNQAELTIQIFNHIQLLEKKLSFPGDMHRICKASSDSVNLVMCCKIDMNGT